MTTYWLDGELRTEPLSSAAQARVALATLPCPTAFIRPGRAVAADVAAEELVHSADTLGHRVTDLATLASSVRHLIEGGGPDLLQLALVPTELPASAATPWPECRLVSWPVNFDDTPSLVTLAPWPVNNMGAAVDLRLTTSTEVSLGKRHAEAAGARAALWSNLDGNLARVDDWTVIVGDQGARLAAPTDHDGAPFDAWLRRLTDARHVDRTTIPASTEHLGRTECGLAALLPWGYALAIALTDAQFRRSSAVADQVNALLSAVD